MLDIVKKPTFKNVVISICIASVMLVTNGLFSLDLSSLYLGITIVLAISGMILEYALVGSIAIFAGLALLESDTLGIGLLKVLGILIAFSLGWLLAHILVGFLEGATYKPDTTTPVKRRPARGKSRVLSYGKPGEGIGENNKFSSYNTGAGVKGEIMTANFVNRDMKSFGKTIHLFNSLKFGAGSGKSEADVDHAIVVGKTCFLIDSKLYKDANYTLADDKTIVGNGGVIRYSNSMSAALGKYRTNMRHSGLKFRKSYIIVHTSRVPVSGVQKGEVFMGSWPAVLKDLKSEINKYEPVDRRTSDKAIKLMSNLLK